MHSNVEKKKERGTDGKHNMSLRRLCAVINVVLKSLSIPIKSNHLFTQVERGVGGNSREPAQTSVRTCKLHKKKKKNRGGNKTCKLLAGNCPPANKLT